jgi:hypothetical protein
LDKRCTDEGVNAILECIPGFLKKVIQFDSNYLLVYYGSYELNKIYDINDFLINDRILVYKLKIDGKYRIVVVTELYMLIFKPIFVAGNLGKLIDYIDIRLLKIYYNSCLYINGMEFRQAIHKFNEKSLHDSLIFRAGELEFKYARYDCEYVHIYVPEHSYTKDQLKELINNKEKNNKNELLMIYQRMIEILSAVNDEEYKIYLKKLKREINNQTNPDHKKPRTSKMINDLMNFSIF